MAYITKFNSSRISRQIDDNLINEVDHSYYKKPIGFLSDHEKKRLLVYKMLLENTDVFFNEYYIKIKDTETYIFENKPAFHKDPNCPNLTSDFDNIKIPSKIKAKDKESISAFRKYAKEHYDLFLRDREAFKAQCCLKFGLVYPEDMRDVAGGNSGFDIKNNYNLQELEKEIDGLIKEAKDYYFSSDKTKKVLQEFRNKMFLHLEKYEIKYNRTVFSETEIKEILDKQYNAYNKPVVFLLQEWLRISLNPELDFEGRLLELLGFKNCPNCYSDYESQIKEDDFFIKQQDMNSPRLTIDITDDLPY